MLFILILGLYLFWVGWTALCLANNYRRARKLGFPIVLLPISSMNILWIVIQPAVISLVERIFGTSSFTRFAPRDWHFREKAYPHIEFGDAWALVTPGQIWFNVADPDAITDIFQRRTQFIRPVELYQMLKLFGRNASTVSWTEWKQHRKIISAPFNELANGIAWTEALNQTRDMLNIWTQAGGNGRFGLQQSTRTVALNVLAATGFGRTNKFNESHASSGDEESGYRTALSTLIDNALFMQLMPQRVLRSRFVPSSWVKLGHAADVFKKYMLDLLDQEKRLLYAGKPGASHLTSSLLRASEEYSSEKPDKPTRSMVKGLTISELLGNIYLINIAGHDTTANSLAYAIIHLAMNPEVQEWLSEEIHTVMGNNPTETWEYEATFKNLKRPLAVMYETLRLFPPVLAMPKYTSTGPQDLTINGSSITVPSDVYVVPSLLAVQTHPAHWGPDALEWKPSRWLREDGELLVPRRGTYLPWSEGAQNCPGKKFSQVTFVAVVASLFQSHRVRPVGADGENEAELKLRLARVVEETSHGVLLRMKDADSVKLAWIRVE